jgi:hypothetical protein
VEKVTVAAEPQEPTIPVMVAFLATADGSTEIVS